VGLCQDDMKNLGLSRGDAWDKYDWRMRIQWAIGNWKMAVN